MYTVCIALFLDSKHDCMYMLCGYVHKHFVYWLDIHVYLYMARQYSPFPFASHTSPPPSLLPPTSVLTSRKPPNRCTLK